MPTSTVCKFTCQSVENFRDSQKVNLYPVSDSSIPENQKFTLYTPSGQFSATICNPALEGFFVPGKDYYLTIAPVPEPAPPES